MISSILTIHFIIYLFFLQRYVRANKPMQFLTVTIMAFYHVLHSGVASG